MKTLDTREYVGMLRELTEQGQEVSVVVAGGSMVPFLVHQRDAVSFRRPDRRPERGDIVFFQRTNGQYILHRVLKVKPEGCYIAGDAQSLIEGPVPEKQIFAIVTKVRRKGKWIGPENFVWKFFAGPWLWVVPLRRGLLWGYTRLKHIGR